MPPKKVSTSRELAKLAGISHVTVTRCFNDHPRVSPETKKRVLELAAKHGYHPNPIHRMHVLAKQQGSKRPYRGNLAFVQLYDSVKSWKEEPYLVEYFRGMMDQAESLGFMLEEFSMHRKANNSKQLDRILQARGIQGVIFGPAPSHIRELTFNWDHYSIVAMQRQRWKPLLHRVTTDNIHAISTAIRELESSGYKKIGLLQTQGHSEMLHGAIEGCIIVHQNTLPEKRRVPPMVYGTANIGKSRQQIMNWYHTHRPDCIICEDSNMVRMLEEEGVRVPENVGIAHLSTGPDVADWTGYRVDQSAIGTAAVDMVVNRLIRNELGVPKQSRDVYLRGEWQFGTTTR